MLDVNLPDLSGLEVAQRLPANISTAALPILQRSAISIDDAARVFGLESGADAYLADPVAPEVLIATVRALVRMRRPQRHATQARAALQAALDATPTGHVVVDEQLTVRELDAAAGGWAPGAGAGHQLAQILPASAGREAERVARAALARRCAESAPIPEERMPTSSLDRSQRTHHPARWRTPDRGHDRGDHRDRARHTGDAPRGATITRPG